MKRKIKKKNQVQFRQWANKHYAAFNSLHKSIKICTLAVAYSIVAAPVHAKAEGDSVMLSTQELDDVVIQSTLIELKNAETGRSIEVIQAAQIQSLPVSTIDELLRYIPGIDAQQRGAFGAQTDFSLRGSNFNQVLLLIDGQKINDPLTAHFNSNIPISPSEIERIEIIRGAASLEYGSDATGGVINIISKTFSNNKQKQGLSANAKAFYGQHNLVNTDGGLFYTNSHLKISGGGLYNKSDGNPLQSGLKAYFDVRNASISAQVKLNQNWSVAGRYAFDFRDFNAQWFYTTYAGDKATEEVTRHRQQVQLLRRNENSSTQLLASGIQTRDIYVYTPGVAANDNKSGLYNMQLIHKIFLQHSVLNQILFGGNIDYRTVASTDRGNHEQMHSALFATTSIKPIIPLNIIIGARAELDPEYGNYFLPQASASYSLTQKTVLRASAGRSVRLPDYTESYSNNFRKDSLRNGLTLGNPALTAEKSWNYEMGFDIKPINALMLNITGFYRDSEGIIDYVRTPATATNVQGIVFIPGANLWFAQNNVRSKSYGIETRLSLKLQLGNNLNTRLTAGHTFLKIELEKFIKENSRYAALQPKHLFNTELSTRYKNIHWSILGIWKIRDSEDIGLIGKYSVWNTGIDIAVYKQQAFISFNINNVFDSYYADFLRAEMPGRWIAGGLKFKL